MSKSRFRHSSLKIAAFIIVCFIGDRVGGFLIERLFMNTGFRYAELYSGDLPASLVFIGNSRGVHMFHRPPFEAASNQKVANLSFNGLPATMLPVVIGDYLKHHEAPERIFVEVSCLGRSNEPGSLERFRILTNESDSFDRVHWQHAPVDHIACKLSHLYRCNSELLWRSVLFLRGSDQDWIMTSVLSEDWQERMPIESIRRFEQSSVDLEAMKQMIEIAERDQTEVSLVLAPYFPGYFNLTRDSREWIRWIEEGTGKTVLDYSATIDDAKLFADPIHLNPDGAIRLAEIMVARGDLQPK